MMEEVYASREPRSLLGITVRVEGRGLDRRITSMNFPDGRSLERDKRYVIAVNSFDARSGGHHFMKLRALLDRPESNCVLHPVQTRDALVDYFRRHKVVQRIAADNAAGDRGVISPVRSLQKERAFACLFRHATSDFLLCWFIAECSSCVGADAKTRITITVTDANAARGSASVDRDRAKFADQHDRHGRPDQEGSKGSRRNVFLSRRADWRDRS